MRFKRRNSKMGLKCPIYNSYKACETNPDCLFLRNAGCAIILGMQQSFENEKKIDALSLEIESIKDYLATILNKL
jgi:hypothetical protein